MCKRLTFLILGLGALALLGATASAATYDLKISSGGNDMEERLAAGSIDSGSSDLEMPYENAGTTIGNQPQLVALRFAVPLAKGAQITKAYVQFTCDETKGGKQEVNLVIDGQLAANAPAFTTAAKDLSSRTTRTKAQVKWAVENWTTVGQKSQTPDLTAVLNEIMGQDGWASGNFLVLFFADDPGKPSAGVRGADAYEDHSAANAPVLHLEVFTPEARNPDPANGAQDVTSPLFGWVAGDGAVSHQVYVGTKPELGDADKAGNPLPINMYFHIPGLAPGVTYYWRVDEIDAAGKVTQGTVWNFTVMPLEAHFPSPADKATDVKPAGQLKWTAGQNAIGHTLYLGTDKAAVEKGDAKVQVAAGVDAKYDFTGLKPFSTYYWRVDEVGGTGQMVPGPVWSFSTVNYLPMNDAAVTLNYNNSAAPFTSEVTLTGEKDWTANGVTDLTLQFTGQPANFVDKGNGAFAVSASGHDIWDAADDFRFVYKKLSGDGSAVVKVESLLNTNAWAKGGVMIRETLADGSKMAYAIISYSSGAAFGQRATTGANATDGAPTVSAIRTPQWVKITRAGDVFSAQYSADGQTWLDFKSPALTGTVKTATIPMAPEVYIGLCVTSHNAAATTTAQLSGAALTGNVAGEWQQAWIGDDPDRTNSPSDLYATVEDSKGKAATVQFGDPAATVIAQPWTWKIPLTSFTGVDLKNVAKLYLGAGNKLTPAAGGSGVVTFDNVRVVQPVVLARGADVTLPGDNVLGVPNNGNWPAAETPWLAFDNNPNTKFLHFNGKTDPVGFQVQVLAGATIVTGLTFTAANDSPERDPVAFELSGSNDGLQGPWTLIAKGDIVDFKGATAWPRFTKNTTPITFENSVAYKFYQIMFTAVRDPKAANSMQIAEVELLNGANIIWVSDAYDDKKDNIRDDQGWIDFLTAQGYKIDYRMGPAFGNGYWRTLNQAKIDALNAADLVIFSRNANSGDYNNGTERDQWNSVKTPLLLLSPHLTRSSHWKWLNTTTLNKAVPMMQPTDSNSPAFKGVTRDAKGQIAVLDPAMGTSFPGIKAAGNGTVLATRADTGDIWIASWAAGKEFYTGCGQIPAGPRVFCAAGLEEVAATATAPALGRGEFNLTDSGKVVFLNLMDILLP